EDARRPLDRRVPDHGGDRRGAGPSAPPHHRRRRRLRGRVPPLRRRAERDGDDAVRRQRVPRDGYVGSATLLQDFALNPASMRGLAARNGLSYSFLARDCLRLEAWHWATLTAFVAVW